MKDNQTEDQPTTVPVEARQVGEVRARWLWSEPCVWSSRMLTALEQGVKGGVWFSLIDKVYSKRNLVAAFEKVRANKGAAGVDNQTIKMFEKNLDRNLERISTELIAGSYRPREIKRRYIPKAGGKENRPLGIPTIRDRVVQTALRNAIEPIYEKDFHDSSYGFRPCRGCKDALRRVDELLRAGYRWVLDADLKSYFDTIDHEILMGLVEEKIADGAVLDLIRAYLKQQVLDGADCWTPEEGTPQGAVISPLLANIHLDPLDHLMADAGFEMVRYADDFVVMCRTEKEARRALAVVAKWTISAKLQLHRQKTRVGNAEEEFFDFLGYRFQCDNDKVRRIPNPKSVKKMKDSIRQKTKRTNGHSMEAVIVNVNKSLVGWFTYFKHVEKRIFGPLDGWIRMRLRSILRKRNGGKGKGRGLDHKRWPNAYFAKLGLFSLVVAREMASQSSRR